MSKQFDKLIVLLKELFQLDQPDLDFGLYRIMHAKSDEITQFLERDLLPQVKEAFSHYTIADKAEIEKELAKVIAGIEAAEMDPKESTKVKELEKKLKEDSVDVAGLENEVYDHLYSFFRRYYHEGDFLPKRVYKPGVYAIPYEGEEVKLHWANQDQYYIKTSEYLRDYAFILQPENEIDPMRVHFRLVDAKEGEHGNLKAAEGKERAFILQKEDFISEENGELVIAFEYRPANLEDWSEEGLESATAAAKKKPPVQKQLLADAVRRVLSIDDPAIRRWIDVLSKNHVKVNGETADHSRLEGHLKRYTARHTFDYFIHKDLGGFLRRELDFYIKNEVMHLDDVENETAPRVEQYLSKIKVIRKVAHKLIDFLAQLEDFQKKLWLKKKFVVETNYCITLDRIPEEFYPEIAANDAQRKDWVRLFAINEIEADLAGGVAYSEPLSVDFLKANQNLVLDTRCFSEEIKSTILNSLENLSSQIDGYLIHSENLQALNLIQKRFNETVTTIYIDPPFNLGENADYLYKVDYKDSSWLSLLENRITASRHLLKKEGSIMVRCNHDGNMILRMLMDFIFGEQNYRNEIIVRRAEESKGDLNKQFAGVKTITVNYDNIYWYSQKNDTRFGRFLKPTTPEQAASHWHSFWKAEDRPNLRYEILGIDLRNHYGQWMWETNRAKRAVENYQEYCKVKEKTGQSLDDYWIEKAESYEKENGNKLEFVRREGNGYSSIKYWISPREFVMADNNWLDIKGYANKWKFKTENSEGLLKRIIESLTNEYDFVLDYFVGSGTTAAVAQKMKRKWVAIEMGDHFSQIKLRLAQVLFGETSGISKEINWKGGGCYKYCSIESYEDAINNLILSHDDIQQSLLNRTESGAEGGLKEQYLLQYMLNSETYGSQSLLNISAFKDPTAYKLKVKRPGSDESREVNVDLLVNIVQVDWTDGVNEAA
ncbi:MAG: DNA methyltransferase [bacterium]